MTSNHLYLSGMVFFNMFYTYHKIANFKCFTHTHTHIITYTLDSFPTIFAAFEIDAQ